MGLMRPSVHPMEHRRSNSLEEYENEMAMSPSHRIANQQQPPHTTAAGGSPRGSDVQAASATANMTARSGAAATTTDYSGDPGGGGSRTTGATNYTQDDGGGDSQTARQPNQSQGTKSDRRLVFADESGGALAEITYSSRTHYSKQAGAGNLPAGRACCVIS